MLLRKSIKQKNSTDSQIKAEDRTNANPDNSCVGWESTEESINIEFPTDGTLMSTKINIQCTLDFRVDLNESSIKSFSSSAETLTPEQTPTQTKKTDKQPDDSDDW